MTKQGPETKLLNKMRTTAKAFYGPRLVLVKYHGSQFGEAGVSDFLGCLDGVMVACEVKAPDTYGNNVERAEAKGPTVKQLAFINRVNKAGGYGYVAASIPHFMEGLEYVAKHLGNRAGES